MLHGLIYRKGGDGLCFSLTAVMPCLDTASQAYRREMPDHVRHDDVGGLMAIFFAEDFNKFYNQIYGFNTLYPDGLCVG